MARQLVLLDSGAADWRLDTATRSTGRRGLAVARAALAGVAPRPSSGSSDTSDTPPPAAA